MLNRLLRSMRAAQRKRLLRTLDTHGYPVGELEAVVADRLDDQALKELNSLLDWNCFTTDGRGRRIGGVAWGSKRTDPQPLPDRRIVMMDDHFGLSGRTVLEVGCFEGVHTIGLASRGATVTAADSRIGNVVKTIVRTNLWGVRPEVLLWDVESDDDVMDDRHFDFVHHVGVLYHLLDPVRHLHQLGRLTDGIMLDTHVAEPGTADMEYNAGGRTYRYKRYVEHGRQDAFSGMHDHAKWLETDDLVDCLRGVGFASVEVVESRQERNGLRVLLFADKR